MLLIMASHEIDSKARWAAQISALSSEQTAPRRRRAPITKERVVQTALKLVAAEGFEALTMRRVAAVLKTGPASLYAHVRNKAELDDLLIGDLCKRIALPEPKPARWKAQFKDVCGQLRDLYLDYPGVSLAAFVNVPRNVSTLRITEGLLSILLAGGVAARKAAWAIDAALLYVGAYTLEASLRRSEPDASGPSVDRAEIVERLRQLPLSHFPNMVAHVEELTAGEGHERFDFTLELLLRGIAPERSGT